MKVYTYSEARQQLSRVLDEAKSYGETRIKRKDGTEFTIRPIESKDSPLDVRGVQTDATMDDVMKAIRDVRDRDY